MKPSDPAPQHRSKPPAAVPFELGALPLLSHGKSRTTLVKGDRLISHGMVIAEGGESRMHAHRHEEHIFLVLSGQARFVFLSPQEPMLLGRLQGILIPADCFYRYCSSGEENLVMVRVGSARGPDAVRVGLDEQPLRGMSAAAGWQDGVPDEDGRTLGDLMRPSGQPCSTDPKQTFRRSSLIG